MTLSTSLSLRPGRHSGAYGWPRSIVAFLPRPYAKWTSAVAAAIATVASVALAATYAQAGFPELSVPVCIVWQGARAWPLCSASHVDTACSCLCGHRFVLSRSTSIPYMEPGQPRAPRSSAPSLLCLPVYLYWCHGRLGVQLDARGPAQFFEITGACSWGLISCHMTPTARA